MPSRKIQDGFKLTWPTSVSNLSILLYSSFSFSFSRGFYNQSTQLMIILFFHSFFFFENCKNWCYIYSYSFSYMPSLIAKMIIFSRPHYSSSLLIFYFCNVCYSVFLYLPLFFVFFFFF